MSGTCRSFISRWVLSPTTRAEVDDAVMEEVASATFSRISATPSVIRPGDVSTLRLELMTDDGRPLYAEDAYDFEVEFMQTDGPVNCRGNISKPRHVRDNMFEATFTATHAGSPTIINARINGALVQIGNAWNKYPSITVIHFWRTNAMHHARCFHTSTELADGTVLVLGGVGDAEHGARALSSVEIFTPSTHEWRLLPYTSTIARSAHTSTIIPNPNNNAMGTRVWVAGGINTDWRETQSCEMFNSEAQGGIGSIATTVNLNTARCHHTAIWTESLNAVVVTGGLKAIQQPEPGIDSIEFFHPDTNTISISASSLIVARGGHTCTLLPNGDLLLAGGQNGVVVHTSLEIFRPHNHTIHMSSARLSQPRAFHTATWIPEIRAVLLVGGYDEHSMPSTSGDLYYPDTDQIETLASRMSERRAHHTATWIPRSKEVLLAGGDMMGGSADVFRLVQPRDEWQDSTGISIWDEPQWLGYDNVDNIHTDHNSKNESRVGRFLPLMQQMFDTRLQHSATLMTASNDVLIVGGLSAYVTSASTDAFRCTSSCELFRGGGAKRSDWDSV